MVIFINTQTRRNNSTASRNGKHTHTHTEIRVGKKVECEMPEFLNWINITETLTLQKLFAPFFSLYFHLRICRASVFFTRSYTHLIRQQFLSFIYHWVRIFFCASITLIWIRMVQMCDTYVCCLFTLLNSINTCFNLCVLGAHWHIWIKRSIELGITVHVFHSN